MSMTLVVVRNIRTKQERATVSIDGIQEKLDLYLKREDRVFVKGIQKNVRPDVLEAHNGSLIEVYNLHQVEK